VAPVELCLAGHLQRANVFADHRCQFIKGCREAIVWPQRVAISLCDPIPTRRAVVVPNGVDTRLARFGLDFCVTCHFVFPLVRLGGGGRCGPRLG